LKERKEKRGRKGRGGERGGLDSGFARLLLTVTYQEGGRSTYFTAFGEREGGEEGGEETSA